MRGLKEEEVIWWILLGWGVEKEVQNLMEEGVKENFEVSLPPVGVGNWMKLEMEHCLEEV